MDIHLEHTFMQSLQFYGPAMRKMLPTTFPLSLPMTSLGKFVLNVEF